MSNFIRARHLRSAAKAVAEHLQAKPDFRNVKVYSDAESREGYALVQFARLTPKGNLRTYKFAMHSDSDGRRIALVKANAYATGKLLGERRVPGDMVFPWLNAVDEILAACDAGKRR